MKNKNKVLTVLIIASVLTALIIFSMSMIPGEESVRESGMIVEFLRNMFDSEHSLTVDELQFIVRKTAHFCEFFIFGAELTAIALIKAKKILSPWLFMPLFFSLLTAVTDEFIQLFRERTSLVTDVLIDFSGALFAIFVLCCIFAIASRSAKRKAEAKRTDTL